MNKLLLFGINYVFSVGHSDPVIVVRNASCKAHIVAADCWGRQAEVRRSEEVGAVGVMRGGGRHEGRWMS